ncbi:MAG: arsenate reductase ArsC [Alphaproteobacteria bacterium]|nr:arsenate reductase ArsC [Alphaproteobacteria bacterium]MBO6863550.1 arsenate reductase ArsC [Alphaproteobacteria bacterium]MEC9268537.1 arsenate reductase ArsC [Pseudomonadota bacterium]
MIFSADDLPDAVMFCCTMNSIRSPMAEGIMKSLFGTKIYVDSVGAREGELDGLMVEVMAEIGIDMSKHHAKTFEQLEDTFFDLIVALSPEAQHHAVELTRTMACDVVFWNTFDPSIIEGSREQRLDAYRQVRDQIRQRIMKTFPVE